MSQQTKKLISSLILVLTSSCFSLSSHAIDPSTAFLLGGAVIAYHYSPEPKARLRTRPVTKRKIQPTFPPYSLTRRGIPTYKQNKVFAVT